MYPALLRNAFHNYVALPKTNFHSQFFIFVRWSKELPISYLNKLNQKSLKVVTDPEDRIMAKCNQMLDMEFQFFSSGYVVNEVNMVYHGLPICRTVCVTPVKAYHLKASDSERN